MSAIVIAPARSRDVAAVAEIESVAFSDPWTARAFRDALANASVYFACAKRSDGEGVLGYVVAWFAADEGEIANLAVDPAGRRQGVGTQLLDAALREGAARGAATVYLDVRDSNLSALALYRARGFESIGRRRDYYRRPLEDAIVLRRRLPPLGPAV